jgi:hypothetical protein
VSSVKYRYGEEIYYPQLKAEEGHKTQKCGKSGLGSLARDLSYQYRSAEGLYGVFSENEPFYDLK